MASANSAGRGLGFSFASTVGASSHYAPCSRMKDRRSSLSTECQPTMSRPWLWLRVQISIPGQRPSSGSCRDSPSLGRSSSSSSSYLGSFGIGCMIGLPSTGIKSLAGLNTVCYRAQITRVASCERPQNERRLLVPSNRFTRLRPTGHELGRREAGAEGG